MPVCQNCKNDLSRASFSKTQLRKEPTLRKCKNCVLSASSVITSEVPTACVPAPVPEVAAAEPAIANKVAAPAPESSNMDSEKFHCIVCDQDLDKQKFSKNQLKKHEGALRCKSCVKNVENQDGAEAEKPIAAVKETATSKTVEDEVAPKEAEVIAAPSQVVDVPSDEDMDDKKENNEEPVTEDVVVEDDVEDKEKEVDDAPSDEDKKPVAAVKTETIEETQTKTNDPDQEKVAEEPKLSPPPSPIAVAVVSPEKATPEQTKTATPPAPSVTKTATPPAPSAAKTATPPAPSVVKPATPPAPSAAKTATPSPTKVPSPASVPVQKTSPDPAPMPKPEVKPSTPVIQSSPKPTPVQTTIPPPKKQSQVELNKPVSPNIADIERNATEKATCCIIS